MCESLRGSKSNPIVITDNDNNEEIENSYLIDLTKDDHHATAVATELHNALSSKWSGLTLREIERDREIALGLGNRDQQTENSDDTENDEALAKVMQEEEQEDYDMLLQRVQNEGVYDVLADCRKSVHEVLEQRASVLRIRQVSENPYATAGEPLYNRFIQAWQNAQDETITLAFHGTARKNIEAICENGFDPKRRKRQALGVGEYFAMYASVSMPYCNGDKQILVVAILIDKSGLTANQNGILVINQPEHQLPLFVIHFE